MIACVFIPYFAAAVERQTDLSLAAVPLVISEPRSTSERVFAVSAEAARSGVNPGMTLKQAQSLCPQARFIPANPTHYQHTLKEISELLATFTAKIEPGGSQLLLLFIPISIDWLMSSSLNWSNTWGKRFKTESI
jgi:nucleotidyltransferase/DNA polymerase involved in DNA repair